MRTIIILFVVLTVPAVGSAATLHVPGTYPTIQDAILAASNGDTVQVDPGTYVENINFKGKAITVMSSGGYHVTVIDGDNNLLPVVRFQNNEGLDSVLDGFTIMNGRGKLISNGRYGGGILCEDASPTITNNLITKNSVAFSGGGIICLSGASPLISNNIITDNHADHATNLTAGGGIGMLDSSPSIINNIISENTAAGIVNNAGGGIICVGASSAPLISSNLISGNTANFGGGIFCSGDPAPTISNNIIFENSAVGRGGGLQFWNSSGPALVTNNTLFGNTAQGSGGGIICNSNSELTVTNMILWNNDAPVGPEIAVEDVINPATLTISYSNVEGGKAGVFVDGGCTLNWGQGMIENTPLFVDESNNDFHLCYTSPCRDTGDDEALGLPKVDFEGDPRIAYGEVDMGADEFYTHLYYTGDATPGENVEVKITDLPNAAPVFLWIGSGVLDPPQQTKYGDWYLNYPLSTFSLGPIPSDGVMVLKGVIPPGFPSWDVPMQAGVNMSLTNLCVMSVQ